MGATLGSGRNEKFANIEGLRESEVEVLKALMTWEHMAKKSTSWSISEKCGISKSSVDNALRHLKGRGIVHRSIGRSWFIFPAIKDKITQELDRKDLASFEESVQDTVPEQEASKDE